MLKRTRTRALDEFHAINALCHSKCVSAKRGEHGSSVVRCACAHASQQPVGCVNNTTNKNRTIRCVVAQQLICRANAVALWSRDAMPPRVE